MSRATYIWLAAVTLLLILVAGACGQGRSPTGPERASSARPAGEPGQAAVDRGWWTKPAPFGRSDTGVRADFQRCASGSLIAPA